MHQKITSMKQPSGVSPYFVESNPQKPPSESSQPQVAQWLVRLCRHLLAAAGLVLLDVEAGLGPQARLLDVERIDAAVEGVAGGHQVVGIQRLHLLIGKPRNGLEPRIKIFGGKCWWNDLDDQVEFNKIEIAIKTVYPFALAGADCSASFLRVAILVHVESIASFSRERRIWIKWSLEH